MTIRRLKDEDAQAVSELIIATIRISNVRDYPAKLMEEVIDIMSESAEKDQDSERTEN